MVKLKGLTTEINIRSPAVGDQIRMSLNTAARRSMNGTRRLWRMGTAKKVLSLDFSRLNIPERRTVEDFIVAHRGKLITYTDQYAQDWVGYINQDPTFTHTGRSNNTFQLSLEVVQV